MAGYDENIAKNPFYLALEKQRPDLCAQVAKLHGIVLVPCCVSLGQSSLSSCHFDSYVLQPGEGRYHTADGQEVRIQERQVLLGSGSSVPILFEETFYNEREQSFSILCISRPVEAAPGPAELGPSAPYCLKSLEEVEDFLGRHVHKLDKMILNFCQVFKEHERKGLRHHMDSVHGLYTRCLQCLLRDSRLVLAKQEVQMNVLKQAVEVYLHHGIHGLIFNYVGSLEASQDAAFNKTTRSLQELQHKDLGVKPEFSINLSRAKRELSGLNRQTSPLLKLLCLRRVALIATHTPTSAVSIEAVCADDLLSVILYLLIKMDVPNWMANLSYMKNFCFSHSGKDELSYCLSTFEAAVEYINLGKVHPALSGCVQVSKTKLTQNLSLAVQSAATPVSCLFEHIANGNEAEVERLLSVGKSEEDGPTCHPLCSCEVCDLQLSGKLNDPSIITSFSRDDRGYTPLHVAAVCGQAHLIDLLVSKLGAPVNATDYHALTPLHLACQKGYQGVTLLLLHYKADGDAQDNNGNTPLHLACMYGHEDCVKALVYYDFQTCSLDLQNDKGDTPLHLASRWGYEGILQVLLENEAAVNVLNKNRDTALHCALNSKIVTLIKSTRSGQPCRSVGGVHASVPASPVASDCSSRRSSVSGPSSPGCQLQPERALVRHRQVEKLLRAVADGDVEMVRYLLEWTDDEEEGQILSQVPLCHPLCQCPTCAPGQKVCAAEAGALGVNSCNADGFTPLHVAATHGHAELTSLLLRHGARVNGHGNQQATPLHLASQNGHPQVVVSLLECNAKLNKKDRHGNTALILACLDGNLDTANVLLQSQALVNAANHQGNTALHEAVRGGHPALVELLLRGGACPEVRNKRQRTPLDSAYELGGKNSEILRALQKASGLSPDDEPIKLLSVPKGTLAHSFVQRLRTNDLLSGPKHAASRIEKAKRNSCSPSRPAARVRTVAKDQAGGRSHAPRLARWHTLDSEERAPPSPSNVRTLGARARTRSFDDDSAMMSSSDNSPRLALASVTRPQICLNGARDDESHDLRSAPSTALELHHHVHAHDGATGAPHRQDTPLSSDTPHCQDTPLSSDTPHCEDTPLSSNTPHCSDTPHCQDTPLSSDTHLCSDTPHFSDTHLSSDTPHRQDTPLSSDTPHCQDTPLSSDTHHSSDTPLSSDTHLCSDTPHRQDTPLSSDTPHCQDTPLSSDTHLCSDTPHCQDTPLSSETHLCSDTPHCQDTPLSSDTPHCQDTPLSSDAHLCSDTPHCQDTPLSSDTPHCQDTPHSSDTHFCSDTPHCQDTPLSSDTHLCSEPPHCQDTPLSSITYLSCNTPLSSDTRLCSETPHCQDTPLSSDTYFSSDTPLSSDTHLCSDTPHCQDTPLSSDTYFSSDTPLSSDTHLCSDTPHCQDTPLSSNAHLCSDTSISSDSPLCPDTPPSSDMPLSQDTPLSSDTPHSTDTPISGGQDTPLSSDTPISSDTPYCQDTPISNAQDTALSSDTPHCKDTPPSSDTPHCQDTPISSGQDTPLSSDTPHFPDTPYYKDTPSV
ncbi:uncharacterized protein ankrd27 isoform X2 [Nerophis lumbriciformis]|uniref:uncharacterized protein ankrd27 isoform X2 n=1 Tax=Nerophis lumbriciformis TaxID=546530 RepID=UPI002ADF3D19|nr:ankyrin repeat domain-containing protein 27-like isoform X2 [Nerophis lumbriciformis]